MKNLKQNTLSVLTWLAAFAINSSQTLAQWLGLGAGDAPTWVKTVWFKESVLSIINYFLSFLWLLTLIFIIYAGVKMVISQWEEEDFESARKMIIYAIIWIVIIVLSWSIVNFALGVSD
jgi:hypothetical protein